MSISGYVVLKFRTRFSWPIIILFFFFFHFQIQICPITKLDSKHSRTKKARSQKVKVWDPRSIKILSSKIEGFWFEIENFFESFFFLISNSLVVRNFKNILLFLNRNVFEQDVIKSVYSTSNICWEILKIF